MGTVGQPGQVCPGRGSSARLLHSDLYIRVYSAVFNIIRKCFTKELSNDEEGKKLCSELCRFFMTNGPIMGHDVIVIGTKVR